MDESGARGMVLVRIWRCHSEERKAFAERAERAKI